MIYMLVPTGGAEWEDMRLFSEFSAVEQVVRQGIDKRRLHKKHVQWCFVIAYDGTDELIPIFEFHITDTGAIIRTSPSL